MQGHNTPKRTKKPAQSKLSRREILERISHREESYDYREARELILHPALFERTLEVAA